MKKSPLFFCHCLGFPYICCFSKLSEEFAVMAVSNNSNPFFTEEDDDDWGSGRRGKIQEQINASEERQLDSTTRALRSIQESESMGIATAEVSILYNWILYRLMSLWYGRVWVNMYCNVIYNIYWKTMRTIARPPIRCSNNRALISVELGLCLIYELVLYLVATVQLSRRVTF